MRPSIAIISVTTLALASGCFHSTELAATWSEPNAQPIHFQKAVTVFVTKDEALRRSVEEKLASSFVNGVPSYRIMPTIPQQDDRDAILDRLRGSGFDGAVVMRVVDVTMQTNYVPGSYWYSTPYTFGGYWRNAWASPYDPGYYTQNQVVSVETQIYSLTADKLVYAARSETTNPASAGKLTDSIIRHLKSDMKKKGLMMAMNLLTGAAAIAVE